MPRNDTPLRRISISNILTFAKLLNGVRREIPRNGDFSIPVRMALSLVFEGEIYENFYCRGNRIVEDRCRIK